MTNGNDDYYAREVIQTVKDMTRQMIEFRQEVTRATLPLYPRITEMEKRREDDAKERVARQKDLDRTLAQQNAVASQQGAAIQQVVSTVKAQGEILQQHGAMLERIFKRQFWGRVIEIALIVGGLALIAWRLRG